MDVRAVLEALWGLFGLASAADAELYSTRLLDESVRAVTAECRRAEVQPASGIIGISDPHTLDPGVIDLIKETGVDWVRAEFHWDRIQPVPDGDYDWSEYDAMVARFRAAGIRILGILTYVPEPLLRDWQMIDQQFQSFAKAAVRRYAPLGVHYWEVFNEPNLTGYGWLTRRQDARDFLGAYTLLLARANKVVRDNDPEGVVVLGGLASDTDRGITAEETMEHLYRLGAQDCFDVIAFHPYGYRGRFEAAGARMEDLLAASGDAGKPVWFNEYGWTETSDLDMTTNPTAESNPMIAAFEDRHAADALFWFSLKDYSARWNTPAYGLADFDLNKRDSFDTFRHLVEQLESD